MAEVDIAGETYQSFEGIDEADIYLGGDVLRAATWMPRNADDKGRGLVSATRALLALPWSGDPPAIADPPVVVKEVTSMFAADLLAKPKLFADASANSNVKLVKGGPAQVEFFRPVGDAPPIPLFLWTMLVNAGLVAVPDIESGVDAGAIVSGICEGTRPLGGRYPWDYPIAAEDHD